MQTILPGKYKHYKGSYYEVIGIATHSETMEQMVVYKALYQENLPEGLAGGNNLWVRPLNMFTEKIHVDGHWIERFQRV